MSLKVLYSNQLQDNPSKVIRVLEPLRRLQAAGVVEPSPIETLAAPGAPVPPELLASADAVFLHLVDMNTQSAPMLAPLLSAALARGVALICDTDDPYFFPADGCSFDATLAPHLDLMKQLCAAAHVVTVTTVGLKQELAAYARNVVVVPNLIDLAATPGRSGSGDRVRVGWSGGPTHADDLAMLLPVIARLQQRLAFDFVIFGMFDKNFAATVERARQLPASAREKDPSLAAFGRMADALTNVKYDHVPSVPYSDFAQRLAELNFDIGVCPLVDTRFNRCRSAVKFYQYVAAKTVTVASKVAPYIGECSVLADNTPQAWAAELEPLILDAGRRQEVLLSQQQFVKSNRSWDAGLAIYERLFAALCSAVKRSANS